MSGGEGMPGAIEFITDERLGSVCLSPRGRAPRRLRKEFRDEART